MHPKVIRPAVIAICLALILSLFAGCQSSLSKTDNRKQHTIDRRSSTLEETQATTDEPTPTVKTKPQVETIAPLFDYAWNPHVFSQIDRAALGGEAETFYYELIDAVMAGEASVPCADRELLWNIELAIDPYFPPFRQIIENYVYEDGKVILTYRVDDEQRQTLLSDFSRQIKNLIRLAGLRENDSPTVRAIKLYRMYSGLISYDYAALDNEIVTDVSCYRGLMELEGICQSFASAYAYLCLQVGVEATSASGMSPEVAHEWTILMLDNKYYYADPTFESGDGGYGLKYFGMTAEKRELAGEFVADEYNIGNSNDVWGKDIDVTDETFTPLWEAVYIVEVNQKNGMLTLTCEKADGSVFEYEVK